MSPTLVETTAERDRGAAPYQRHRPEHTLLYQIVAHATSTGVLFLLLGLVVIVVQFLAARVR